MKLYSDDTEPSVNGSSHIDPPEPEVDDEPLEEEYDYSQLFDAPSYANFIKTAPNSKAKTYEKRVASMMKAGLVMSINNQQWPDAATFLKHGPGFATAAGNLAAEDPRVASLIEMLTAPDSPYVMFALTGISMVAQLFRNHQPEINKAGQSWRERRAERKKAKQRGETPVTPPVIIRLGKRQIKLPIRFRIKLPSLRNMFGAFLAPTQRPDAIAAEVFNDPNVMRALHKMGIYPRADNDQNAAA